MNILNAVAFGLSLVHPAGGVLLCNEYGCRSSPYFPPPIVAVGPPVVYMPANPPARRAPAPAYNGPIGPPAPVYAPGPNGPTRVYPPYGPQRRVAVDPPPRPPRDNGDVTEQKEIEEDITAFCDKNPEEAFCGKLGAYLRNHPDRRRK